MTRGIGAGAPLVLIAAVAALFPLSALHAQRAPRLTVSQSTGRMDEAVRVRVAGLEPGSRPTLTAEMELGGYHWLSSATFEADRRGRIDLANDRPLSGSYSGRDPMGLFWSMKGTQAASSRPDALAPVHTRLRVLIGGREVASRRMSRTWLAPTVRVARVRQGSVTGMMFDPGAAANGRGVLVLSGSEGGIREWDAALLASRGFTVLAAAYFRAEGRPDRLTEIPLEDLEEAIGILRAHSNVGGRRIGVVGSSKGGELALLLGATYPQAVGAVVSYASGAVVGPGLDDGNTGRLSSWTLGSRPVRYARCRPTSAFLEQFRDRRPIRLRLMNEPCLDDAAATAGAFIAVDRIEGDVLLITGGDDQTGPATRGAQLMVAARRSTRNYRTVHFDYPSAGHAIYSAFIPTTRSTAAGHLELGGTPAANAAAQAGSWPRVVAFLSRSRQLRVPRA
jgi:dienelactone hydrolase